MSIWISTLLVKTGIHLLFSVYIFLFLDIFLIAYSFTRSKNKARYIFQVTQKSIIILIIVFISFYINTSDIRQYGWKDYFPLTNADTFSYLGHIDQLVFGHYEGANMSYKSDVKPLYQHAVNLRSASVSHAALINTILRLETHQLFFFLLRAMIPLIILACFWLLLILDLPKILAFFATFILLVSNFYADAIFQQFFSTAVGLNILIISLGFITYLFRYTKNKILSILTGWIFGVYGITSPEAHIFLLPTILFFCLITLLNKLKFVNKIKNILLFITGYFFGILFPLMPNLLKIILDQSRAGISNHPGNWIAQYNYIVQQMGIALFNGSAPLKSVLYLAQAVMFLFITASIFVLLFFLIKFLRLFFLKQEKFNFTSSEVKIFFLNFFVISLIFGSYILYSNHQGYALLKLTDYHAILLIPITFVFIYFLSEKFSKKITVMVWIGVFLLFSIYSFLALREKEKIQIEYLRYANNNPRLHEIQKELQNKLDPVKTYALDLKGDFSDFTLYATRDMRSKIISLNYSHRYGFDKNAVYTEIIRSNAQSQLDINQDLNRSDRKSIFCISQKKNYVIFDKTSLEKNKWLEPECNNNTKKCFRWLSESGKFRILNPSHELSITFSIYKGPDLTSSNKIVIYVGDKQYTILNNELESSNIFTFTLADIPSKYDIAGHIDIEGPQKGIRQISVSTIYAQEI